MTINLIYTYCLYFQHPELFRWFKDFVGFKEGVAQPEPAPSPLLLPQPRQERITGDAAMEIGMRVCTSHLAREQSLLFVSVGSREGIIQDPATT